MIDKLVHHGLQAPNMVLLLPTKSKSQKHVAQLGFEPRSADDTFPEAELSTVVKMPLHAALGPVEPKRSVHRMNRYRGRRAPRRPTTGITRVATVGEVETIAVSHLRLRVRLCCPVGAGWRNAANAARGVSTHLACLGIRYLPHYQLHHRAEILLKLKRDINIFFQ